MTFKVGDMVKPKPGFDKRVALAGGMQYPLPAGKVTAVASFGVGQVVKVGDHPYEPAGCFEPIEAAQ